MLWFVTYLLGKSFQARQDRTGTSDRRMDIVQFRYILKISSLILGNGKIKTSTSGRELQIAQIILEMSSALQSTNEAKSSQKGPIIDPHAVTQQVPQM
jgi:hypothetical protein